MNSAVSERNFWGNRMQNHVFYPTFLIALEMLDKEGVAIDTVFCSLSICMPNPEYSKNIIVSPWGHRKHQDWCGTTHLGIGVLKSAISSQIDQNAIGQPWVPKVKVGSKST